MIDEMRTNRGYITQEVYSKYANNRSGTKGKFESRENFCEDLSSYDMKLESVAAGKNCRFDTRNCSGFPMEYDAQNGKLYVDGSDAHTLLVGATGAKKSRLIVMPGVRTIAGAGEDMIVCDPKGEIYRRTAGYLQEKGYKIHAINLREPKKGDGWNILEIPYRYFLEGEVDKACELINDATVSLMQISAKDPYWDYSARDMLFGLVLLLFQIVKDKKLRPEFVNMKSVLKLKQELFCSTDGGAIQNSTLWKYAEQYELVRMRLMGIVICPEKTLACIVSTFDQHMSCFSLQPQIVNLLAHSTFALDDLGFSKMAIFLIMPDEKTTYHKIITIFIKQMYESLIDSAFKRTPENRFKIRVNFILDEFSSLPRIADFPQMISASRSRNIRFMLVVQSKHQLKQRYEDEADTIMSNCINWMFLTSREVELLSELSELGGNKNQEKLISLPFLQHLNKEKGECLIFSGRKFPYVSSLPDIEAYDHDAYPVLKMQDRASVDFGADYENLNFFETKVIAYKMQRPETDDDKKEFSTKIDELFMTDIDNKFTDGGDYDGTE